MGYNEVLQIISELAPDLLPAFFDRFERWPKGSYTKKIQRSLARAEKRYRSFGDNNNANLLYRACVEIELREKYN